MEAEWTDAEITKLIEFYETNPMLYDPADANYRNRDLKRQKENEIAAILGKPGKRTRRRRRLVGSRRFCGLSLGVLYDRLHIQIPTLATCQSTLFRIYHASSIGSTIWLNAGMGKMRDAGVAKDEMLSKSME